MLSVSKSERDFEAEVVELARIYGWCGFHVSFSHGSVTGVHALGKGDDHYDSDGFPDWLFVRGATLLYRELKTEKGKLTIPQVRWHKLLAAAGQDVTVWRPSQLPEIAETFRRAA